MIKTLASVNHRGSPLTANLVEITYDDEPNSTPHQAWEIVCDECEESSCNLTEKQAMEELANHVHRYKAT